MALTKKKETKRTAAQPKKVKIQTAGLLDGIGNAIGQFTGLNTLEKLGDKVPGGKKLKEGKKKRAKAAGGIARPPKDGEGMSD